MSKVTNAIIAQGTVVKQISANRYVVSVETNTGPRKQEYEVCRKLRKQKDRTFDVGDSVSLELNRNDFSEGQIVQLSA